MILRNASPIEWEPVAQAVTTAKLSPLKPYSIAIWPAAMLEIIIGTMKTLTRSGPFSRNFWCSASVVWNPPMPAAHDDAGAEGVDTAQVPAPSTTCFAAAIANWV